MSLYLMAHKVTRESLPIGNCCDFKSFKLSPPSWYPMTQTFSHGRQRHIHVTHLKKAS